VESFIEGFARHGYLAVFVLMLLESACIPIPSEVTMLFAGFLASPENTTNAVQLNFVAVALLGVLGNLVGSWVAYGVGYKLGRAPLDRFGRYVGIRSHDVDKAEKWWAKHGSSAVLFSRVLPVIRTFISLPAGMEKMPFGRFTLYTTIGCVPWVFALTGVGYALGNSWKTILGSFSVATYAIIALLLTALAVYIIRRRRADRTPAA
jgi:membrane protein DedA with SNARE-associated domain